MTKTNTAIKIRESISIFLGNIEYKDGAVKRFNEIAQFSEDMMKNYTFPSWVESSDLLGYCMGEAQRVKVPYNGKMPAKDIDQLSRQIEKDLMDLPHAYDFYFKLPDGLNINKDIIISEDIKIFTVDSSLNKKIEESNIYTYLQEPIFYSKLAYSLKSVVKVEAKYSNLEIGSSYLKVHTSGLISRSTIVTEKIDPFHIYKILLAYLEIKKLVHHGGIIYEIFSLNKSSVYGKEALVYKLNNEFVTDITRPQDESNYVSKLVFTDGIKEGTISLEKELTDFAKLISPMNNIYLSQEQNKIINSLYWYFESSASSNDAFRTLLQVSMFDSFFSTTDNKESKFKSILFEFDGSKKPSKKDEEWLALENIYHRRNDIGHGNVHLLEVASTDRLVKTDVLISNMVTRRIYNKFILSKISKLLTT